MKIPIVAICGPTASGKTALAVSVAKSFDGEVISADSMQIYRGMNIGTAKPTVEEMQGIVHHMIDVADIDENYNVCDYCTEAHNVAADICKRGKLPIVAGGTGLYIDSMINDLDFSKSDGSDKIRNSILELAEKDGADALYSRLEKLDPKAAASIHKNNVKRVVRALEHIELTGEKFSDYKNEAKSNDSRYSPVWLFIDVERETLYERINRRADIMMENGLLDEAEQIYKRNLPRTLTALCGIGYKELFEYFDGKFALDNAVAQIKQNSRRYAKRQLTWFRRNEKLIHLPFSDKITENAIKIINERIDDNGKIQL